MSRVILDNMINEGTTTAEAMTYFDSLEPVETDFMFGEWQGDEIQTGFPMEGLLTASNWYGKYFYAENDVHPLVFKKKNGQIYQGNPQRIFLGNRVYTIPRKLVSFLFPLLYPWIKTNQSNARLRQVTFRGKTSASMIYDQLPIIDVFRKVDDQTVMGVMDIKGAPAEGHFFFVLYRQK